MNIFLTVIIRVYNRENEITNCINSVLSQSLINEIQILIINDCSTDNSLNVVNKIKEDNPNICIDVVSHEKNMGRGKALNTAKQYIKGKYCCILDSDDNWINNTFVETLKNEIGNIEYDFLYKSHWSYHVNNIYLSELYKKCPISNLNYYEDHYTWWFEDNSKLPKQHSISFYKINYDSDDRKNDTYRVNNKNNTNSDLLCLYEYIMYKRGNLSISEIEKRIERLKDKLNDVLLESYNEILQEYELNKELFYKKNEYK